MMLRGLLAARTLLLSSVCQRAPHCSMSSLHVQINRANQINPKHPAYWQSRGVPPGDWESAVAQLALEGQLQAIANAVASRPSGVRAATNRRTDIIVQAVQASLGGKAEVHTAGSQAKHTDTSSSDHDLWVYAGDVGVSRAQRTALRDSLVSMLTESSCRPRLVLLRETSVRLYYKKGQVDIVFDRKLFNDKIHSKPTPRFENNPKARAAVRLIKDCAQKFEGDAIEKAVLAAQQQKKGQRIQELTVTALGLLATGSQVKQFVAYLNSQLPGGMRLPL